MIAEISVIQAKCRLQCTDVPIDAPVTRIFKSLGRAPRRRDALTAVPARGFTVVEPVTLVDRILKGSIFRPSFRDDAAGEQGQDGYLQRQYATHVHGLVAYRPLTVAKSSAC